MKQKFLFLLAALFSTMMAWAQDDVVWFSENDLVYEVTNEDLKTVDLKGYNYDSDKPTGDLVIPATVNGYSVTSIHDGAFADCRDLTSVEIPGSVTSIGVEAFSDCSSLSSIEIADGVTSIDVHAFYGCKTLTILEIPASVTSIGEEAFFYCTGLTLIAVADDNEVYDSREDCNAIIRTNDNTLILGCSNTVIPNSVTSIGDCAFEYCDGLTSIEIPNSVKSIGDYAFYYIEKLTSIKIPNSVTSIGEGAFGWCPRLTSVEIPGNVSSIGKKAFVNCAGLTSVTISNGVTSIGESAFDECENLISLEIPGSVTSIGDYAFFDCGLTSIAVSDDNQVYDSREDCNAIIRTNDNTLICGCKNTVIPNSVTSIGVGAFGYCVDLTSIVIPSSVTSIGNHAFNGCTGISDIYCYSEPETLTWGESFNPFKPNKETLCHVEADKLSAYQEKFAEVNVTFVGDLTAGIESIAATATDDAWYTLAGVKLQGKPTVKGVYLYQGKAVLVK